MMKQLEKLAVFIFMITGFAMGVYACFATIHCHEYITKLVEQNQFQIKDNLFRFSDKTRIGKSTDKVMMSTDKIRKSTDKVRKSTDKLNDNHKKIIQYTEEKGVITNKEVQNLLKVKDSRALKILKELVEAGILKKEGKLKGSYYKLK